MSNFGTITWNGVTLESATGGQAHVEHYPDRKIPEREIETETIPGRNGDIVRIRDAWKNVDQEYEIAFGGTNTDYQMQRVSGLIAKWLFRDYSGKYLKLSDTYDPGYFRLAYFKGPYDIENIFNKYGRATITFSCRPERFDNDGDVYQTVSYPGGFSFINGTGFKAKPFFMIQGSGELALVVTDDNDQRTVITISSVSSVTYIDCETMNVYSSTGTNLNNLTVINGDKGRAFPTLDPGRNAIEWSGSGITSVQVKTRLWRI